MSASDDTGRDAGILGHADGARPDPSAPRPIIERLALGGIALLVATLFGGIAVAALAGGEVFLSTMAGIGALMTVWAAAANLRRG
jgi:hypothetical protein